MDFDTFKEDLAKAVKDRLELIFDRKYSVETHTVEKMNQSYEALVVKPEDGVIGVNIGIDAAFKEYSEGRSFDMIVRQIASAAEHALDNHPAFDLEALTDYSQMKGKLAMEVVSAERNAELLETVPHKNMEDMAIVYRIVLNRFQLETVIENWSKLKKAPQNSRAYLLAMLFNVSGTADMQFEAECNEGAQCNYRHVTLNNSDTDYDELMEG